MRPDQQTRRLTALLQILFFAILVAAATTGAFNFFLLGILILILIGIAVLNPRQPDRRP